jgi:hypothetical protein
VKNGVATLRSTAKNLLESASSEADAFQAAVDEVRNYLKIRDPPRIKRYFFRETRNVGGDGLWRT